MSVDPLLAEVLEDVRAGRVSLARAERRILELADAVGASIDPASDAGGHNGAPATRVDDVVVVAANAAYGFYHRYHAYVCQPNRPFRPTITHLGFYTRGIIQPEIPRIVARHQDVQWSEANAQALRLTGDTEDALIAELIDSSIRFRDRSSGSRHDVFLLASADDPETVILPHAIAHTGRGRGGAWTQRQRYTSLEALRRADTTEDL